MTLVQYVVISMVVAGCAACLLWEFAYKDLDR